MKLLKDINEIITLESASKKDGRKLEPEDLGKIQNASIVYDNEQIIWVGKNSELPAEYKNLKSQSLKGHCITPELIDSHTHITFGGNRAKEYAMRLNGADYQEIANAGGGILETMRGTREISEEELFGVAKERCERLYSYGVGTIEIKSGYGLDSEHEYKLSNIINKLKNELAPKIQIIRTFMAAHAVPKSYNSSESYLKEVVLPLMDKLSYEDKIDHVDIFHEQGYFTSNDTITLFESAKKLGLKVKMHADEFNDNKGAVLACKYHALSADHLLMTTEDGINALANSNTVANFLPGTGLFLGKPLANARKFLDAGVKVGIASDYNPGSCHCDNVLLISSIAAPLLKLNQTEAWSAITLNAAHALGLRDQGALVKGNKPRFSIFKTNSIDEITYSWGRNLAVNTFEFLD